MKTLYVLRHGQAVPESEVGSDHARGLTLRGRAEVRHAAESLTERGSVPPLILSSSATRARETAEVCLSAWSGASQLVLLDELYLAGPTAYLAALSAHAEPHTAALVVGHNPGIEALVHTLTERSEHLATAALLGIELTIDAWAALSGSGGALGRLVHSHRA